MQEWFGLKDGHNDFMIENDSDARLFFARKDLMMTSKHACAAPSVPASSEDGPLRRLGRGKDSHDAPHGVRDRNTEDFEATVVFVECPTSRAKTTFQVAHSALLDALGLERANSGRWRSRRRIPTTQRQIQELTQSGDVATAFSEPPGARRGRSGRLGLAARISLSAGRCRLVGLPPALTQSNHFVRVLEMLGQWPWRAMQLLVVHAR